MTRPTQALPGATELRRTKLDRPTAMRLAATEYERFAGAVAGLSREQWTRPTDCPPWDVRALACHVLGMAEMAASVREGSRQRKAAMRADGLFIDALTDLQVRKHADLARATGEPMQLTAEHDGVLVADVVAEWAERHGRAVTLRLTGPAGGTWSLGTSVGGEAPELEFDAVEFCRVVSGREAGTGLLATEVPF